MAFPRETHGFPMGFPIPPHNISFHFISFHFIYSPLCTYNPHTLYSTESLRACARSLRGAYAHFFYFILNTLTELKCHVQTAFSALPRLLLVLRISTFNSRGETMATVKELEKRVQTLEKTVALLQARLQDLTPAERTQTQKTGLVFR